MKRIIKFIIVPAVYSYIAHCINFLWLLLSQDDKCKTRYAQQVILSIGSQDLCQVGENPNSPVLIAILYRYLTFQFSFSQLFILQAHPKFLSEYILTMLHLGSLTRPKDHTTVINTESKFSHRLPKTQRILMLVEYSLQTVSFVIHLRQRKDH